MEIDKLYLETRRDKTNEARGKFKRMRMRMRPAQEKRFWKSAAERKRNRADVSFLCRYILNTKSGNKVDLK